MGFFSPFHWLFSLVELALFVVGLIASGRILQRMGFSVWWVLLAFVPVANVYGLWKLAQIPWPKDGAPIS